MRILITGASGQLGSYLLRYLSHEPRFTTTAWAGPRRDQPPGLLLPQVDLRHPEQVGAAFEQARPELIIHTAAIARMDICHADSGLAERVNVDGTGVLAALAAKYRARLVYVSTDLVFDGQQGGYRESDAANPVSVYARTKLAGERNVSPLANAVVARVSLLFGPSLNRRPSFFDQQCDALRQGRSLTLFADEWRTPLSLATAARALVELACSDFRGILHIGGPERLSRWEMGVHLSRALGCDPACLISGRQSDVAQPEPRPRDVSLDSTCWRSLFPRHPWPTWDAAVTELGIAPRHS